MRSVVVTGVSSGIGRSIARLLVANGVQVFGSVRKAQDGDRLSAELGTLFKPMLFDVTDEAAVARAAGAVRLALQGHRLWGLVNNAGMAVAGPLLYQPMRELRHQLEVNVVAQVGVCQAFGPLLGVDQTLAGTPGRIVMISSESGKSGSPFMGAYCASKHALEGLAESLRRELLLFGIDVVIIGPGFIATKIWEKAEQFDLSAYSGTPYAASLKQACDFMIREGNSGIPAEQVARTVWRALSSKRPKTRYAEVKNHLMNALLPQLMPRRVVDRLVGKELGWLSKQR